MTNVAAAVEDVVVESEMRTAWARGSGSRELAEALGGAGAIPIGKDWSATCVSSRVELLVTQRLPSFSLVSIAVPVDVDLSELGSITAAIGGGPHSELAAEVAGRLGRSLDLPSSLMSVFRSEAEREALQERLEEHASKNGLLSVQLLEASSVAAILNALEPNALLIVGAPGGSWLQRQFFGPGHRLAVKAPAGAVVVRHAPRRAFHEMQDASLVLGPQMAAGDAIRIAAQAVVPVAESGQLVGLIRIAELLNVAPSTEIGELMEPPVSIEATEPLEAVDELRPFLEGAPVPVVTGDGKLAGCIP